MLERRWYAQDREDKRLYQALTNIKQGYYIDIGAYEPEFNSVTKVFYDDGWSGINVEPNPRPYKMLDKARPRDVNLEVAVTWRKGPLDFHVTNERGWSSLREDVAFAANEAGMNTTVIKVDTMSLADVFDLAREDEVHFLKIDVEGSEGDVIASGDWKNHRPWIVVAESNFPQSRRTVHHHGEWEPYLLSKDYVFQMSDGLNRWYIAKEKLDKVGSLVL